MRAKITNGRDCDTILRQIQFEERISVPVFDRNVDSTVSVSLQLPRTELPNHRASPRPSSFKMYMDPGPLTDPEW